MKIAHITTVASTLNLLLLNQLGSIRQAGYEVVTISTPGADVSIVEATGFRHIPVPMERSISPVADLVSLWRLYRVVRREGFTIVHTHNPKPGLIGQLAAKMARTPIIVNTVHGFYFHQHMSPARRQFFISMEKVASHCSDVILSQNSEDIQTAIQEGICPVEKIQLLGNGIDLSQFDPDRIAHSALRQKRAELGFTEGAPVIGFVGRLAAKRKGFLDYLLAGQQVIKNVQDVRLLIVGAPDPGKSDTVDPAILNDSSLSTHSVFMGRRPYQEMPLLYALMDVVVLPSLFEGLPRVVMEASAMGVPVVTTNVRGNREAVEHGSNGLLVPLGDVQALADAIIELLTDQEKAQRMGEEGRRIALERFDERLVFEKVKAEYARLLHEKGLPLPKPLPAKELLA
jgi:glycosyltransferase involved in cell wall biosynthesis